MVEKTSPYRMPNWGAVESESSPAMDAYVWDLQVEGARVVVCDTRPMLAVAIFPAENAPLPKEPDKAFAQMEDNYFTSKLKHPTAFKWYEKEGVNCARTIFGENPRAYDGGRRNQGGPEGDRLRANCSAGVNCIVNQTVTIVELQKVYVPGCLVEGMDPLFRTPGGTELPEEVDKLKNKVLGGENLSEYVSLLGKAAAAAESVTQRARTEIVREEIAVASQHVIDYLKRVKPQESIAVSDIEAAGNVIGNLKWLSPAVRVDARIAEMHAFRMIGTDAAVIAAKKVIDGEKDETIRAQLRKEFPGKQRPSLP